MRIWTAIATFTLIVGMPGSVAAKETQSRSGKNEMVNVASRFTLKAMGFINENEINKAVGYLTIALDIARETKDADLVMRIEKTLAAVKAINMVATAVNLEEAKKGVPAIRALGCKMASEAPAELRLLVKKYTKVACETI